MWLFLLVFGILSFRLYFHGGRRVGLHRSHYYDTHTYVYRQYSNKRSYTSNPHTLIIYTSPPHTPPPPLPLPLPLPSLHHPPPTTTQHPTLHNNPLKAILRHLPTNQHTNLSFTPLLPASPFANLRLLDAHISPAPEGEHREIPCLPINLDRGRSEERFILPFEGFTRRFV